MFSGSIVDVIQNQNIGVNSPVQLIRLILFVLIIYQIVDFNIQPYV